MDRAGRSEGERGVNPATKRNMRMGENQMSVGCKKTQTSECGSWINEEGWTGSNVEYYDTVFCRLWGTGGGTTQDPDPWGCACNTDSLGLVGFLRWFGSFTILEDL